jgi:putative Mn2+ efflux pump MntP
MLLNNLQKSPEKAVPIGMMLVTIGLMMIIVGVCWSRFSFLAHLWPNRNDFLRGVTFGIAIGLEAIGVMIALKAAASRARKL